MSRHVFRALTDGTPTEDPTIKRLRDDSGIFGLDVPGCVRRQVYIMEQDAIFIFGSETGK